MAYYTKALEIDAYGKNSEEVDNLLEIWAGILGKTENEAAELLRLSPEMNILTHRALHLAGKA